MRWPLMAEESGGTGGAGTAGAGAEGVNAAPPGAGGAGVADWSTLVSTLPAELQSNPTIKNLKDWPTAAKALVDAQNYNVGALRVPKADATPDEWRGIYGKLGMPATVEGYTVPEHSLPEGVTLDPGLKDWFFKTAHEAGLSTSQVHTMLRAHLDRTHGQQQGALQTHTEQVRAAEVAVREKYGAATDRVMTLALRAVSQVADEATQAQLTEGGLPTFLGLFGGAPWMVDHFVQLGQQMAEDHLIVGDVAGTSSPTAAQAEWTAIQGNMQHPYWSEFNPGHADAVKKVSELFQVMAQGR